MIIIDYPSLASAIALNYTQCTYIWQCLLNSPFLPHHSFLSLRPISWSWCAHPRRQSSVCVSGVALCCGKLHLGKTLKLAVRLTPQGLLTPQNSFHGIPPLVWWPALDATRCLNKSDRVWNHPARKRSWHFAPDNSVLILMAIAQAVHFLLGVLLLQLLLCTVAVLIRRDKSDGEVGRGPKWCWLWLAVEMLHWQYPGPPLPYIFECLWLSEHINHKPSRDRLLRLVDSDEELVDIMPFWSPVLPGEARPWEVSELIRTRHWPQTTQLSILVTRRQSKRSFLQAFRYHKTTYYFATQLDLEGPGLDLVWSQRITCSQGLSGVLLGHDRSGGVPWINEMHRPAQAPFLMLP